MRIIWSIIFGCFFVLRPAWRQHRGGISQTETGLERPLLEGAEAWLSFSSEEMNVGTLSEDDHPSSYTFHVKNDSGKRLVFTRTDSSCGCTEVKIANPVLLSGEETDVVLTYSPFGRPGKIFTQVWLYADCSDEKPVACLTLKGSVTPSVALWKEYRYSAGALKLRRKVVRFGDILPGQKRMERIVCANSGDTPLQITALADSLPSYLSLQMEPSVLEPAEEGKLLIRVDGSKLPEGEGVCQHRLILEGLSVPAEQRTLTVLLQYGAATVK